MVIRIVKYPKSVFLILCSILFDKCTFFTLQTTTSIYLLEVLQFSQDVAMVIFHTFSMFIFFFPLMGAIIADSWLGRYRTICFLSTINVFGFFLLMVCSTPWVHSLAREMSLLGLFIIAFGTGCIKPCLPAFGTEQFKLPEQEDQISGFISLVSMISSFSSILTSFLSPILRKDISCFGLNSCYLLVFVGPFICVTLIVAILFFGRSLYKKTKPESNLIVDVSKCIFFAVVYKLKTKEKRDHWLDHAENKCNSQLIEDIKTTLRVFKLFIVISLYYSVYQQSHSRWPFQAIHMDTKFFNYFIKPEQLQLMQNIITLIFLPTCQFIIYPLMGKICSVTPLRKIAVGGILAATSFVISGILELPLESTYTLQPSSGLAQIRIFNTINCPVNLSLEGQTQEVAALGLYQYLDIPVVGNTTLKFGVEVKCPNSVYSSFNGNIRAEEKKALTYTLKSDSLQFGLIDKIEKSESGDPTIRALTITDAEQPGNLRLNIHGKKNYHIDFKENIFTEFIEVIPDSYNISINGVYVENEVSLMVGGIYTIVGRITNDEIVMKTVTVSQPFSIHIFWQIPQITIISLAEAIISVTALEFSLSQAPASMKSVVLAGWYLSIAMGNLIVVVIQKAHFFERQVFEFFLYAGLLYAGMLIFAIMAKFYKYVDSEMSWKK